MAAPKLTANSHDCARLQNAIIGDVKSLHARIEKKISMKQQYYTFFYFLSLPFNEVKCIQKQYAFNSIPLPSKKACASRNVINNNIRPFFALSYSVTH